MKACNPFLLIFLLLGLPATAPAEIVRSQTVGNAYDLQSDELLYRETHCVNGDNTAREVIYRNREGDLIAHKLVDYRSGTTTPSFVQQNYYSQELIEVAKEEGRVVMTVRDTTDPGEGETSVNRIDPEQAVVIDAGFDEFVRENWDALVAGEAREFLFPFADRSSLVELRIRPAQCTYETDTDQCFRLEVSNWFYRLLADPVELGYDADERRLTRYRGLSNIGDANGNGQVVDIRYDYDDLPAQACLLSSRALTDNADYLDPPAPAGERES